MIQAYNKLSDNRKDTYCQIVFLTFNWKIYTFFIHFWLLSLYPSTILHLSIRKKDKYGFWK
ncbi:predicted protein [Enterococcus faecium Com15]|nr:predicted protein [Enterococcus faecium Com15]